MVAGDLVNTAAPAPVRRRTRHRPRRRGDPARGRRGAIAFEAAGEQALKGKAAPGPGVARAPGRRRARRPQPRARRSRRRSSAATRSCACSRTCSTRPAASAAPGSCRVIGPAGIGKSRLALGVPQVHRRPRRDGLVARRPVSPAYGEGISFWALGEMVRGRAGLLETDDEATTRDARSPRRVAEHVPDEAERRWIEPALLALLGIERGHRRPSSCSARGGRSSSGSPRRAPVVHGVRGLPLRRHGPARLRRPPARVEPGRADLRRHPRPAGAARAAARLGRRQAQLHLALPRAARPTAAMRELLAGLVPGLPESAVAAIVARADGIPLYAVETVRMLLAEGTPRRRRRRLPAGRRPDRPRRPGDADRAHRGAPRRPRRRPTGRSSRTPPSSARASRWPALAAVVGLDGADARAATARRSSAASCSPLEADPRSPERGQYAFVQALIREVAYNTLAEARPQGAATSPPRAIFESLGTDELAGALAGHYLAAHANSRRGTRGGRARRPRRGSRCEAAAERATGLGANEQALRFFEQALTVTVEPTEQAELLSQAGNAAALSGRHESAERHFRRAIKVQRDLEIAPR